MSLFAKMVTATKLAARGEFGTMLGQLRRNTARWRLSRHGGRAFVHHDPGFPFVCHPDWADSVDQFCNNAGDHWEFKVVRQWLVPGDAVIDIGASLGLYTFAMAAAVGSRGRVIAVEAAPYVHQKLTESTKLLGATQVVPIVGAVADAPGTVVFFVRQGNNVTSEQSLRPSEEQRKWSTAVEVPALTLVQIDDDYLPATTPALVKIDIEGAEASALKAVPGGWFGQDGPFWLLEINPEALARFGALPDDIIRRFPSEHFERWLLEKHPLMPGITATMFPLPDDASIAAIDFGRSLYYNFFAVPRGAHWHERRARIRQLLPTPAP